MELVINGTNLPGRAACGADGALATNVHVGVQRRREPSDLVCADATSAHWSVDIEVVDRDGVRDFRGPEIQGRGGDRFVYLTWGDVDAVGTFHMFRRAKLMLDRIESPVLERAIATGSLTADVDLTGPDGGPRCARVDPPAIRWSAPS